MSTTRSLRTGLPLPLRLEHGSLGNTGLSLIEICQAVGVPKGVASGTLCLYARDMKLIERDGSAWPRIRIPGPRESGKWSHGRIGILCFSFTDEYPARLNNFLWTVHGWPVINWISILWSRGGVLPCSHCRRTIWPHQCYIADPAGNRHMGCRSGFSAKDGSFDISSRS